MDPKGGSADSFGTFLEILQGKKGDQSADDAVVQLLTALEQWARRRSPSCGRRPGST